MSRSDGAGALRPDLTAAANFGRAWHVGGRTVFVVNTDRFFLTHRASWAVAILTAGSPVTLIAADTGHGEEVRALGIDFRPLTLGREQIRAFQAVVVMWRLFWRLLSLRPRRVFLVATVAYTLGWPAAIVLRASRFVIVATGAGRVLSADRRATLAAQVVQLQLRLSARLPNVHTIFQIAADRRLFLERRLAAAGRVHLIAGTGIDCEAWSPLGHGVEGEPVKILFAARLFREKGVYEFVESARALADRGFCFVVAGAPDFGVSSSVRLDEIESWTSEGVVDYRGEVDDMRSLLREIDLLVLPTRHPEGTPRILMEAAACGVPAVVSDQPGCRAVVDDGITGVILGLDDDLTGAIERLATDRSLRERLGAGARAKAEREFALQPVLAEVFAVAGVMSSDDERTITG